jgi:hypothetical protein
MPSAGERRHLEQEVALKESRSGTSVPVLSHGMWKDEGKGVHVATAKKPYFLRRTSLINNKFIC